MQGNNKEIGCYEGQWINDKYDGQGTQWYNYSIYHGSFRNGMKNGYGVWKHINGHIYYGTFEDDLRSGVGAYIYSDGYMYKGQFLKGNFHGWWVADWGVCQWLS